MFAFGGTPDLSQQVTEKVGLVSKVVWPALATLVPAGITAAFKWAQDHSRGKLRVQLTERVSALAKAIAELPAEVSEGLVTTPRAALMAEMNEVLRELSLLQTRAAVRKLTPGFSAATAVSKVRSALLLYKPKGAVAWLLHLAFFSYLAVLGFALMAITSSGSVSPTDSTAAPAVVANVKPAGGNTGLATTGTAPNNGAGQAATAPGASDAFTNAVAFVFIFGIAGIPPMIIRYYAAKIHRRQLESVVGGKATQAGDTAGVVSAAV